MEAQTELILFLVLGFIAIGFILFGFTLAVIQYKNQKKDFENQYSLKNK